VEFADGGLVSNTGTFVATITGTYRLQTQRAVNEVFLLFGQFAAPKFSCATRVACSFWEYLVFACAMRWRFPQPTGTR
jgi:hypothetical protein